jgi:cysteine desulfurase
MGIPPAWALGSLRISLGYDTRAEDIEALLEVLPRCVERERRSALAFSHG